MREVVGFRDAASSPHHHHRPIQSRHRRQPDANPLRRRRQIHLTVQRHRRGGCSSSAVSVVRLRSAARRLDHRRSQPLGLAAPDALGQGGALLLLVGSFIRLHASLSDDFPYGRGSVHRGEPSRIVRSGWNGVSRQAITGQEYIRNIYFSHVCPQKTHGRASMSVDNKANKNRGKSP